MYLRYFALQGCECCNHIKQQGVLKLKAEGLSVSAYGGLCKSSHEGLQPKKLKASPLAKSSAGSRHYILNNYWLYGVVFALPIFIILIYDENQIQPSLIRANLNLPALGPMFRHLVQQYLVR